VTSLHPEEDSFPRQIMAVFLDRRPSTSTSMVMVMMMVMVSIHHPPSLDQPTNHLKPERHNRQSGLSFLRTALLF
jgi:hypothetical protein